MQNGRFPAFEQADGQMQPGMLAAIRIEEGADGRFEAAGKTERGTHLDIPPELAGHKWHTEQGCRKQMMNSSPPKRAARSPGPRMARTASAARTSPRSPVQWPYRSLTSSNRSRSTIMTAKGSPVSPASTSARSSSSEKNFRFGSFVSAS